MGGIEEKEDFSIFMVSSFSCIGTTLPLLPEIKESAKC
jgi:hypothetical protein